MFPLLLQHIRVQMLAAEQSWSEHRWHCYGRSSGMNGASTTTLGSHAGCPLQRDVVRCQGPHLPWQLKATEQMQKRCSSWGAQGLLEGASLVATFLASTPAHAACASFPPHGMHGMIWQSASQ
jgi:hypothetical protein